MLFQILEITNYNNTIINIYYRTSRYPHFIRTMETSMIKEDLIYQLLRNNYAIEVCLFSFNF